MKRFEVGSLVLLQSLVVSLRLFLIRFLVKVYDELEDIDFGINERIEDLVFYDLEEDLFLSDLELDEEVEEDA